MDILHKSVIILELLFQLLSVTPYTVVLKPIKSYTPVKVYRYELRHAKFLPESNTHYYYQKPHLGQKIYPVVVNPGRDGAYKTRVPVKKEKGKYYKTSSTTEKSTRLLGLSQHLVPPVSNQLEEYSEAKEEEAREENDIRPLVATPPSPLLGNSFPSFGQNKGRVYSNPGDWATPAPQVDPENSTKAEFTPSQLYLQIRHKNTVIHVPQSEALKDAETLEELINAPRLKELSRTTHVQETYSEEGYEDAGYDHAGQTRHAQHGEVYDAKDEGKFNIKEPPIVLDYDSDLEESQKVISKNIKANANESTDGTLNNKLEPRISRSRSEISKTSVEYSKKPKTYKGEHKYSSRIKTPVKAVEENIENQNKLNEMKLHYFENLPATFPSYFDEMQLTPENVMYNNSIASQKFPNKLSAKYRKNDSNSTKIYPVDATNSSLNEFTDFKPYMSFIDSQTSPSAKSLKYSRIYSKKTKQLRLEPYNSDNIFSPPPPPPLLLSQTEKPPSPAENNDDKSLKEESINERIVLPTIGYINSLTTAHFGKGNQKPTKNEPEPQLTDALNLTEALNFLRNSKNQKNVELPTNLSVTDIRSFEPMKIRKIRPNSRSFANKMKRDVYLTGNEGKKTEKYEGDDESDLPHDEKNEEIDEDERRRIEEENLEKEKYEADLREEITNQEKEIIKETFKNIGVEKDVSEVFQEFPDLNSEADFSSLPDETSPVTVDVKKYPYYKSRKLPENSALRYATDPLQFPKKSGYQMEFYDSRERLIQCPDFHPDLDDLPNLNSTENSNEQSGESQRLLRVGDKIACLRRKYFDPEPFDNPIFIEKEIDYVGKRPIKLKKSKSKLVPNFEKFNENEKLQASTYKQHQVLLKDRNLNESIKNSNANNIIQTNKPVKHTPDTLKNNLKMEKPRNGYLTNNKSHLTPSTKNPTIGWKTTYHQFVRPQVYKPKSKIVKPYNCLPNISDLGPLNGNHNLTIECNDVILVQEVIKNTPRLRVIPKEKKSIKKKKTEKIQAQESFQTDWIPIVGYSVPKKLNGSIRPLSRRTDEVTKLRNDTTHNTSSTHYVIDELKEDEKIRKGEVMEDMNHYMKLIESLENTTIEIETKTEATRRKRETLNNLKLKKPNSFRRAELNSQRIIAEKSETETLANVSSKPFERKRPLTRLSGIDFLVRYHKNKGKLSKQKTEDFWKIANPTTEKNTRKTQRNKETENLKKYTRASVKDKLEISLSTNKEAVRKENDTIKSFEFQRFQATAAPISEKIIKKPEILQLQTTQKLQSTTPKSSSFSKIITKVSKETSETNDKPKTVTKSVTQLIENSTTENFFEVSSAKPKTLHYEMTNRNSNLKNDSSAKSSDIIEEQVLYYVVNLKTGRGKWITDYKEDGQETSRKFRKLQAPKENLGVKRSKKKKKTEI